MGVVNYIVNRLNLSGNKQKIVKNLFWAVAGKVTTLLGGLFVGIIIAKYLGPSQYGLMNYVVSYVFLFQTFALFGLDNIEIREEARSQQEKETIIGTAFTIKMVLAIITMALTIGTSLWLESDSYTTLLVTIYAFSIIFNTFSVIRNYFTSIVENEYIVKSEILQTLIGILVKLTLLYYRASLSWFVAALALDAILLAAGYIISFKSKSGLTFHWRFNWKYAVFLIKESFPILLTSAAVIIYQRIDQVMIGRMVNNQSVGYFSVASRLVEILIYIPTILAQTITPILINSREISQKLYEEKAQTFMNLTFWLTTCASIATSLISYWLIRILFGEAYLPAVAVLQVLSFKAASVALSNTAGSMLVIEGLQRYAIFRDSLGCVVCILLNYIFLPKYGMLAAAVIAILSNMAAGYLADAIIPAYRHLFVKQTRALFLGWKDLFQFRHILFSPKL